MIIYQIKNNKGETLYVGETTRKPKDRFNEHLRELKKGWHSNLLLQLEFDKCDGNIKFEVLEKVKTIQETERSYIKRLIPFCNMT